MVHPGFFNMNYSHSIKYLLLICYPAQGWVKSPELDHFLKKKCQIFAAISIGLLLGAFTDVHRLCTKW